MPVEYGPWIAFNPGDTPPDDDAMVQPRFADDSRQRVAEREADVAGNWYWRLDGDGCDIIAYRVVKQPVRGEAVFHGSMHDYFSLHPGGGYRNPDKPARVTFTTADGLLIPGTYTGPDGATIKIEVSK